MAFSQTPRTENDPVVVFRNVCKAYETGTPILERICMCVKSGEVYGLLGSSGCGKTTLLSLILGLVKWDSGEILVFGQRLSNSGLPLEERRHIGYMPQELALQKRLTPKEVVFFYGRLYNLKDEELREKWVAHSKLLGLTSLSDRLIMNLSGGQKRRVSLILALLHSPRLLVLDEPTVGLDPLLRTRIWKYLHHLTTSCGTTVLITTHYIEELRHAHRIGVMRNGRMIAEHSPNFLMQSLNAPTLEATVLEICKLENCQNFVEGIHDSSTDARIFSQSQMEWVHDDHVQWDHMRSQTSLKGPGTSNLGIVANRWSQSLLRIFSFAHVLMLATVRNHVLAILIVIPMIQLLSNILCVGVPPKWSRFGVVNEELLNWTSGCPSLAKSECSGYQLSCVMINQLFEGDDDVFHPVQFWTTEEAREAVEAGDIWGYIHFKKNYTNNMLERGALQKFTEGAALEGTTAGVYLDMSEIIRTYTMAMTLYNGFSNFLSEVAERCDADLPTAHVLLKQRSPIYGSKESALNDYIVPAMIILIILEVTMVVTPLVFLAEHHQGTLDRARVAGLHPMEEMSGVVLTVMVYAVIECILCYGCLWFAPFEFVGSFWVYILFSIVTTLCGLAIGLSMAIVIADSSTCIIFAFILVPIFYVHMGGLTPIEAAPQFIRPISSFLPLISVVSSFRSCMNRGVGLTHPTVWPGIFVTLGWTIGFFLFCVFHRVVLNR